MKTKIFLMVIFLTCFLVSCTTGQYMTLKSNEKAEVLGSVQSVFLVPGAFRYRQTINRQAYISLMAEAQKQYPDIIIDIRDISWAIGRGDAANNNYEYIAIGKIIRLQN